ncbi:2-oxoglutarate and Fe(II) dioxygenase domain containing protein 1 [Diplocarpon rosae]|nr:2-oxoglutarate and Fe(II) dioxygenase domain containing protein 1 [Diplocarpon rosae]
MKRKANDHSYGQICKSVLKKRAKTVLSDEDIHQSFRKSLFARDALEKHTEDYASSEPYKHGVIGSLINEDLLRSVRDEIRENVQFTPKETDIYRIHQSGDLANLDGLDDGALEKLPSLLKLRDAIYSSQFRKYISTITGSGELSGRKTDMAINVYTPGCHLLCHDDVIGSRRISYILYLTDPDVPWKEEWGGALRLFPTTTHKDDGVTTITPDSDTSKVIPPAWNQLSFFAVQPGLSFHDVEEVYHAVNQKQLAEDGGRIRMAISGWFHIPQLGEEGYVEGEEETWGKNSSLKQLQGNPDRYDCPQAQLTTVDTWAEPASEKELNEADLDFLLKYMAPTYLTPDTLEAVSERFLEESTVTLDGLLSKKFSARVREYIEAQEATLLPKGSIEIEKGPWRVAKPPHKHRYLYLQPFDSSTVDKASLEDPIKELIEVFLSSRQFRQWLELATQGEIQNYNILARRFRRGLDYALATSHEGEPRIEIILGLTPTPGWDDVGGYEVYMAGDEDDDADAAIFKASTGEEDDNILFTMPAAWNKMSIVLRDGGVLKFVKYVSKNAKGDRWDVCGTFGVRFSEEDGEEDMVPPEESEEEEEFKGFPDSEDSNSA